MRSKEKIILHSDMNNFYASVECVLDPKLKNEYVAVCGRQQDRHGIVLAKNEKAKALGVKTGEPVWQAVQKCPRLVTVSPHFDVYMDYSRRAQEIYCRYTDMIEPFGLDECWLDVSGSTLLFGGGREIADRIRNDVKRELGLTVSVGVSFNKIFAKLGSDMKKPDAVTCISRDSFREQIWGLDASEMLGVGRATSRLLSNHGIYTIGDLAASDPEHLRKWMGINGVKLWNYACGRGADTVAPYDYSPPVKSIGHGITCTADLSSAAEVRKVMFALSRDISHKLRRHGLKAGGIAVGVKDTDLRSREYSRKLNKPVRCSSELTEQGFELFRKNYDWSLQVRAVTIRAIDLVGENREVQVGMFDNVNRELKRDRIEQTMETIRAMYGKGAVTFAGLLRGVKLPGESEVNPVMPKYCEGAYAGI